MKYLPFVFLALNFTLSMAAPQDDSDSIKIRAYSTSLRGHRYPKNVNKVPEVEEKVHEVEDNDETDEDLNHPVVGLFA
jgi:hypothetical protein